MAEIQLGAVEARFADIIWEREPVTSGELIKLAADKLAWKRTTTHTVLHSVYFSCSVILSFLAIFQDFQCAFLIFHVF